MSDFVPITRTKIIIPRRRPELLARTRLLRLFDELLDNRLVIVAAPAGYGKTSLLVDFAHSTQYPVCWYSLDTLDQDPQRFIAHFISAISQRFPGFGKTAMAALQSMGQDKLDLDVLVSLIINEAFDNITEHFVLVLDDFHLVEGQREIVYFINRFLQDVDENCHLVLASRSLLTLPDLPLMVARSQVGGLSFEELCFQPEEIQILLKQNYQLDISEPEAAELARDTEGWVTGLLLSTQVMGRPIANRLRVARVSGVGLYEYLAQQVLAQQPEEVQSFLLRTSLLEEFDARLCEEVIGKALDIQPLWRDLVSVALRFNLFVLPVGEDGAFLRYHHLFHDFLRDRIRRDRPEEAKKILSRLADVYIERQDWERAYSVYKSLGDMDAIVRLVEQAGSAMIVHGRLVSLSDWLASLPADLFDRHPTLVSLQGTVTITRGDLNQGLRLLDQAISGLRSSGGMNSLAYTLIRRSTAYIMSGRYTDAYNDTVVALSLVPPEDRIGVIYADGLFSKGIILSYLGQLNESLAHLKESLAVYQSLKDDNTAAKVWVEMGRLYKMLGKYSEAEVGYLRALEYYQATSNLLWQANLYNSLGVLQHTRSDYVTATSSFEKAIRYARLAGSPRLEAYALASIGDLYQELDALQETFEAYRQAREIAQRIRDVYLLFYLNLAEARLKQTIGDFPKAQELLQAAQVQAEERGLLYDQHLCRVEHGRHALAQERYPEALADFSTALNFFIQEGYQVEIPRARLYMLVTSEKSGDHAGAVEQMQYLRVLLNETEKLKLVIAGGREVKPLLEQMQAARDFTDFIGDLLIRIGQYEQSIPGLRRMIRRHAVVVPFAPPKVTIRALGRIQVKLSDHLITSSEWQVQAARDLFFLLLAHPEGLTKEQVGEYFWPDSSISELKLRFKNTMYRLRHAAGKDVILFQGESLYLFNREMDYEYDVESFTKEMALAEKAETREQSELHYQNALKHYHGDFLPDLEDTWAVIERERMRQMHIDALLRLATMHLETKSLDSALALCQRVLQEDPCQEDAHRTAMRVYGAMGNRVLIIRQYEQCKQALLEEVDAPPSYQTQALYQSLIQ